MISAFGMRGRWYGYRQGTIKEIRYCYDSCRRECEFRALVAFDAWKEGVYPFYLIVRPGKEELPTDEDGHEWHVGDECFYKADKYAGRYAERTIARFEWHKSGIQAVIMNGPRIEDTVPIEHLYRHAAKNASRP